MWHNVLQNIRKNTIIRLIKSIFVHSVHATTVLSEKLRLTNAAAKSQKWVVKARPCAAAIPFPKIEAFMAGTERGYFEPL